MAKDDWRSAAAYDYAFDLDAADLAWEALRRHPDYQSGYDLAQRQEALGAEAGATSLARRWGLTFSRRPASARLRAARPLAARMERRHGDPDPLPS
jgi:hypothetical protein